MEFSFSSFLYSSGQFGMNCYADLVRKNAIAPVAKSCHNFCFPSPSKVSRRNTRKHQLHEQRQQQQIHSTQIKET